MAIEKIDGVLYINGYLCNDAGKPITINNGYSSEEEHEAHAAYKMAKYYSSQNRQFEEKKKSTPKPKRRKSVYVAPREDELWK